MYMLFLLYINENVYYLTIVENVVKIQVKGLDDERSKKISYFTFFVFMYYY